MLYFAKASNLLKCKKKSIIWIMVNANHTITQNHIIKIKLKLGTFNKKEIISQNLLI